MIISILKLNHVTDDNTSPKKLLLLVAINVISVITIKNRTEMNHIKKNNFKTHFMKLSYRF